MRKLDNDERVRLFLLLSNDLQHSNFFLGNRIVEPRRPGTFIDTSLLGRIHSVAADTFADGRTITHTNSNTTTTTTYRDNPSTVDLTLSKTNGVAATPPSNDDSGRRSLR